MCSLTFTDDVQSRLVSENRKQNISLCVHSASMNKLAGRNGAGCAEIPSPAELDALKAAAAGAQEANQR